MKCSTTDSFNEDKLYINYCGTYGTLCAVKVQWFRIGRMSGPVDLLEYLTIWNQVSLNVIFAATQTSYYKWMSWKKKLSMALNICCYVCDFYSNGHQNCNHHFITVKTVWYILYVYYINYKYESETWGHKGLTWRAVA